MIRNSLLLRNWLAGGRLLSEAMMLEPALL
jgi:hypothetical protein